jgi:hypothetical protein
MYLVEELKDGKSKTRCKEVRDLSFFQDGKTFNDNDRLVLNPASDSLPSMWEFTLFIPLAQVKLQSLLIKPSWSLANP